MDKKIIEKIKQLYIDDIATTKTRITIDEELMLVLARSLTRLDDAKVNETRRMYVCVYVYLV